MKQFTFFIFTGGEGFQLGEFVHNVFLFLLPFTYWENSEIKSGSEINRNYSIAVIQY